MDFQEFEKKFNTQEQCLDYLVNLRWSNGVCCSREDCQEYNERHKKNYKLYAQYRFRCGNCRNQVSVISGTLFQDTQYKLLPLWFRTIWYITSQKGGTSALGLQKFLGLGSYRTAWTWLHKIRKVLITKQDKLQGTVIVDNFSIKIKVKSDDDYIEEGYYLEDKHSVLIAVEVNENKIGRIRMSNIDRDDSDEVAIFVKNNINPSGTTLLSGGNINFSKLPSNDYSLKTVRKTEDNFQPVREVISYLERKKLLNSLSCKGSDKYLDNYLNECCFKFNNRNAKDKWFDEILQNAVNSKPINI